VEQKLMTAAAALPEATLDFQDIQPTPKHRPRVWRIAASLAACLILLVCVGFVTVEAKEYRDALHFFDCHGLSTQGLSRDEIKAVYRDITTKSFTYAKTAEVIQSSLSKSQVGGYELPQENSTPEDVENLWNYKNFTGGNLIPEREGLHYRHRSEYKENPLLGFEVHDRSYLEKYDGEALLWSVSVTEFWISGFAPVSDGVIAYGETPIWSSTQNTYAWLAKIDENGVLEWKHMLNHGFEDEYIAQVVENADGSYAVFSRGDFEQFCLSQYSPEGKQTHFRQTEVGNYGIWNAARFGDGYIVQLGSYMTNEHARIVKVDREGNITESFSYSGEDAYYYITDMMEFDGLLYLSTYSVPKPADESQDVGGRHEIAGILEYLFDHNIWKISSEKLTPMVRENYTAMLLVCDPHGGIPQEFYSAKGSLGGKLALSQEGQLLWDVESIADTFFSPATSAFTIGGTCIVYRYTFDTTGALVSQEKTGELTNYYR